MYPFFNHELLIIVLKYHQILRTGHNATTKLLIETNSLFCVSLSDWQSKPKKLIRIYLDTAQKFDFSEEILNGKLHVLYRERKSKRFTLLELSRTRLFLMVYFFDLRQNKKV